ncbi:MAG: xanthine dehydrogenase family protein molybdopterin-binding subunit [Acetobacteraceae bacterium]|nr:xanthine dehydrogenase family protein molybdopterin-binding subunit [Acetobacteraceae bacterium]
MLTERHVGRPRSRVDGPLKVTGRAKYAADYATNGLLHAVVVTAPIAKGRIARMDTARAEAVPGVLRVFTHENRPRTAWFDRSWQDQVGPPGSPFRPLYDDRVHFALQPAALVVAEEFEVARHAAGLVGMECEAETPETDLKRAMTEAYVPPKRRSGIAPPPKPRGDEAKAFAAAPVRLREQYGIATEFHNAMEPHATTVIWKDGELIIHDKTQGAQNSQDWVCSIFGLAKSKVRVVSPFVGGAFGSGLRPGPQLFLAVMAALSLERSVKLVLHRDHHFGLMHRPETFVTVGLGATPEGKLCSVQVEAVAATSRFEDHQEVVVNWPGLLYDVENAAFDYRLAQLDTHTPSDMRAPGAPLGMFAAESALDELAAKIGICPMELRLLNHADEDRNDGKNFTSKELRAAYQVAADRFGWRHRSPEPRSMREGQELIGWGMATGVWEAQTVKMSASILLRADGTAEVRCGTADIGTGTYTILSQIAAEELGLPLPAVNTLLNDSAYPAAQVEGGSWTAASAGTAVQLCARSLKEKLLKAARGITNSPLASATMEEVRFTGGRIVLARDPSHAVTLAACFRELGEEKIEVEETATPGLLSKMRYSSYAHAAVFAEVRVDEELGQVRVTRVVNAVAAGRILNPKTARSQILGGVVFGIGQALHEEGIPDHALGRWMNHNMAEYHLPVNADVPAVEVIFVEERDALTSPIGVKGLGEIGIVGTAAAIANAIHHATGKRLRGLPMTLDKVLPR